MRFKLKDADGNDVLTSRNIGHIALAISDIPEKVFIGDGTPCICSEDEKFVMEVNKDTSYSDIKSEIDKFYGYV